MPTGDGVQKRPSFEDEVKKFSGFATREGEILDPKTENLNPVAANVSEAERQAGATTVEEAAAGGGTAKQVAKEDATGEENEDDSRMISMAEAKKMAAAAAAKRIAALTKDKRRLERQLGDFDDLRRRVDALSERAPGLTDDNTQRKASVNVAPNPEDFEFGEMDTKYIKAVARYEARQELLSAEAAANESRQREAEARQSRELTQQKAALSAAGTKDYDDFEEVVIDGAKWSQENKDDPDAWPLSAEMFGLCAGSQAGHHVLYHLASHPDEARQIFAKSPGEQGAWFARMEAKHATAADTTGKPPLKVSKAPSPPRHIARGGTGRTPVATDSKDFSAVEAAWRDQNRRRPN